MKKYVVLVRGINVGGKNKISMATLRTCLEALGFMNVSTYIASGNILLESDKSAAEIKSVIEKALPRSFTLDSELIKVLILSHTQLKKIVQDKPKSFGEDAATYYSDAIFLIDISVKKALSVFSPREGVDKIWPGDGVIYSQRLGAERTKSRLGKIIGTVPYQSMTIRSWNTVRKLLILLEAKDHGKA